MTNIDKAHHEQRSIRIEKLSTTTDTGCCCLELLEFIGKKRVYPDYHTEYIGNVWRAKIGKKAWAYGRSIEEALAGAYAIYG